jgi:dipeptidyl-peptidase-4
MHQFRTAIASLVILCLSGAHLLAQAAPLTIESITSTPSLIGTAPASPRWSPTSRELAFLWNEAGGTARSLWIVPRSGTPPRRVLPAQNRARISDFVWLPAGDSLLFIQENNLWQVAANGGGAQQLTTNGGDRSDLSISPDGTRIGWLSDGDLYVLSRRGGSPVRLTSVSQAPVGTVPLGTYFRRDVEIGSATWGGDAPNYSWSPDSKTIAVHYVDRRGVPTLRMPYYGDSAPSLNVVRRSAPGDANEVRKVGLVDVSGGALTFIELPDSSSTRVVNFAWSPSGTLLIDRESDDAIDRALYLVDAGTTTPRRIWKDHRSTRIYNDVASTWSADGRQVLMTGDLDDRYRLYALTPGDTSPRALTPAAFDVNGEAQPNGATRSIFYSSNEPTPSERHVWMMRADGSSRRRLTTRAGTHTPFVSPDGQSIALITTDDVTPSELYLLDVRSGAVERRITRSQPAAFAATPWVRAQYVTLRSRTDTPPLHARILFPPGLDSTKKYPVLFGPVYSNTVRNRWQGLYATLQQYLAIEKGYIVVQVDVRGSTGYGRDFREKFLMDWGGQDLEDLESAVDYMKSLRFVDPQRFGIWGSSYGGTLTVYSLLKKPGLFQAGVAGAPATDPRFFGSDDVAIARRPQTHPQTFTRGARQYAGNLRDHLLIIHGMQDDVVPFATSVALAEEFMRLGKTFDFAFAPSATHGWTQRPYYATYLLRRLVDHFDRYLGPGPR